MMRTFSFWGEVSL